MDLMIAFYKGSDGWIHRVIRWWTKSQFSHAELVMPDGVTWISISPFLSSRVAPRIQYRSGTATPTGGTRTSATVFT